MFQIAPRARLALRDDLPVPPVAQAAAARWRFGHCEVRPASRELIVDGLPRRIQPRPFDLLVHLIEHCDRVLSADELLDAIWGRRVVQPSSLTVAVNRIRSVLRDDEGAIIRTYHRVGYRFVAALEDAGGTPVVPRPGSASRTFADADWTSNA